MKIVALTGKIWYHIYRLNSMINRKRSFGAGNMQNESVLLFSIRIKNLVLESFGLAYIYYVEKKVRHGA